jgi:hypothetical protein
MNKWKTNVLTAVLLIGLLLASNALAMSSTNYRLDWFTPLTGGGGGPAESANYAINLTVGQTAIDAPSSANYGVGLGFWHGAVEAGYRLYLPLIVREEGVIILVYFRFNPRGRGDDPTTGSIADGAAALSIANATTWQVGHGIRVRRAGDDLRMHSADAGWTIPPGAPDGAEVVHDVVDKIEGAASVRCHFTGMPPDSDGDGTPGPVDVCEVDLGGPIALGFDELRFWIKSSAATNEADLRIRILRFDDPLDPDDCDAPILYGRCPTFELDIPALDANVWSEVFVELERGTGNGIVDNFSGGHRIVTLECREQCDGIEIHLDDFWLVRDLIATVAEIQEMPGDGATFQLNRAAGRTVSDEMVYHDDTVAVRTWLQEADQPGGAILLAPPGIYYINQVELFGVGGVEGSYSLPLYNDTRLRCADPNTTTFKNTGRPATGPGAMFRSAAPAPANIVIEHCGFDWNGWNLQDFASALIIQPHTEPEAVAQNIHIRHNKFFDSNLPGMEGCDLNQDECATRQRHHILVRRVDGVWIENNQMSGGGRIKTGGAGLGRNMYIRNNVLDFVNDNGITIVDTVAGVTEQVEITDNTITNPVSSGIFFGADGEPNGDVPGMILRNVTVARNHVSGFFHIGIIGFLPESAADVQVVDNFVLSQRDRDIRVGNHYVAGILIRRGNAAMVPATDIQVEGNTVMASGIHAVFNVAGMPIQGPISELGIANNEVLCDGCGSIDQGIWLRLGAFENVEIRDNTVDGARTALAVGYRLNEPPVITVANIDIVNNSFLNSISEYSGQISITANQGESIEAQIAENRIHGGTGFGILCQGAGTFLLTDLSTNDFIGNAGGDISGCPLR